MTQYNLFAVGGAVDGTEIIGPVRQRGTDVTLTTAQLRLFGLSNMVLFKAISASTVPVRLTVDGNLANTFNSLPIASGSSLRVIGQAMARNPGTNDTIHWDISFALRRNSVGAPTFSSAGISIAVFDSDPSMLSCVLTIAIDSVFNAVSISGTGIAATVLNWTANLETTYAT